LSPLVLKRAMSTFFIMEKTQFKSLLQCKKISTITSSISHTVIILHEIEATYSQNNLCDRGWCTKLLSKDLGCFSFGTFFWRLLKQKWYMYMEYVTSLLVVIILCIIKSGVITVMWRQVTTSSRMVLIKAKKQPDKKFGTVGLVSLLPQSFYTKRLRTKTITR